MSLNVDGRYLPGLSIVRRLQTRRVGLGKGKGVTKRVVGGIEDDGGGFVFYHGQ